MTTVLLVRHGRTSANATGTLAGWSPDVHLDDLGREQAARAGRRLASLPVAAIVTSPLERTVETAHAIAAAFDQPPPLHLDESVGECHYGEWTGKDLRTLARDPLWKVVQAHPSAAVFPGGESMAAMQLRAVTAVRAWNARLGEDAVYVVVSHGDVIKAIIADAAGSHLDHFQRIAADPCSISAVRYAEQRPFVLRVNDGGDDLSGLAPAKPRSRGRRTSDAPVGGGAGSAPPRRRRPSASRG